MIKNIILTSACEDKNLKGILTLENTKNNTLVTLKTYNFSEIASKLILGIKTYGEFYKVELKNEENYLINKSLNLNDKISAVIISNDNGNTKTLVWGSNETTKVWKTSLINNLNEEYSLKQNSINKVNDFSFNKDVKVNNSAEIENSIKNYDEEDEEIETIIDEALNNDVDEEDNKETSNNKTDFLSSIEGQIDELLNNYEEEKALEEMIENSKFVKVNSEGENFYIFGVIYENNQIRYIVYGIPGEFSVKPEDEYKSYYQWLPLNPDNPEGYGYYLMYQDAITGDQIEIMFE